MAIDLGMGSGADRSRIDLNEAYEVQHWAEAFGVTEERLREVVRVIGPSLKDVELYLVREGSTVVVIGSSSAYLAKTVSLNRSLELARAGADRAKHRRNVAFSKEQVSQFFKKA